MGKINQIIKSPNIKSFISILLILISIMSVNSAEVVIKQNPVTQTEEGKGIAVLVLTFFIIGLIGFALILLFVWGLVKIFKMLMENPRKRKNIISDTFELDLAQTKINYDILLKKRNWKLMWLFWKRKPVYIETKTGKLEVIGQYEGECNKKEGFYLLSIYNKQGMFKYINQIIIIPLEIKDKIVKKIDGDGRRTIFLQCEGLDSIQNSDYYLLPLIPDSINNNKFLDFSDLIHKQYFEVNTYRDIITENLSSYKYGIIKSVETNPFVHFGRRSENFKK